jgi:chemotaxis signal transduction protein
MPDNSILRVLVWRAGPIRCGAEIERLREVLPPLPITPLPGAPPAVAGLVNVRGGLVTVVDVRALLGHPTDEPGQAIVITSVRGRSVGLLVDEIGDLASVPDSALVPTEDGWEARLNGGAAIRLLDLDTLLGPLFQD